MRQAPAFRREETSSGWRKGNTRTPSRCGEGSGGPFGVWRDTFTNGQLKRVRERIRLAPASMNVKDVQDVADEYLDPLNRRLESIGSATNFQHYVNNVYNTDFLPLMAKSTQERYPSVIKNYLMPAFGKKCLRDLTPKTLQHYFTGLVSSPHPRPCSTTLPDWYRLHAL